MINLRKIATEWAKDHSDHDVSEDVGELIAAREFLKLVEENEELKLETSSRLIGQEHRMGIQIELLQKENDKLKRIITKELSENDDLGSEFVYVQALKDEIKDLKEVQSDTKRLTIEIDVILCGEAGAAKQASLCDLVSSIATLCTKLAETGEK